MLRSKAFSLLKPIPLIFGQSDLACKCIHPAIASHGHRCHRRGPVDYRQRYKTYSCSAGGRTISASHTKVMAEDLPGVLVLDIGGTHGVLENLAALLKKHFHLITMKEFLENKKEMSKKIQSVFVFECRPTINRELLESLPNLKVIGNSGVGVDHLDLKMISNFGVKVTNTPHAVADPTADMAMALMLASARRLVEGCQIAISPDTKCFAVDWLGVEVTRATLGIIGMGSIGYKVAQRARAFNMKILYHNRNRRRREEEEAVGAHYCEKMEDLLKQSDFVMLVVNLTPETHKLIGKKELGLMKPTATLVNISRGAVIDQDALVEALQKKIIRAAALDVTHPEPLPRDHPLLKLNNIIITPHIGTATVQAIHMMAEEAIANMLAVLNGQPIPNHGSRRATWAFSELNWWHTWDVHVVFLEKHFYLFIMKEFLENRKHMSKKVQAIYLWWHKPVIDQELLQSLPNLKVIVNSGARMGCLGLKLVASFGVKTAHAPCAVSNSTADRLVEGYHIAISSGMEYCEDSFVGVKVTGATLGITGI